MVPLTMPYVSCGEMPVPMALHDQMSHVVPQFNNLHLRNESVPLTLLSASCDAHVSTNGVI